MQVQHTHFSGSVLSYDTFFAVIYPKFALLEKQKMEMKAERDP